MDTRKVTATVTFTDETGVARTVNISWDELVTARSAFAEAYNASNRLCLDTMIGACEIRKAREFLADYRENCGALRKILGLEW